MFYLLCIIRCISLLITTRSSFNFNFTPDDGLWFRPKYRITSNIINPWIPMVGAIQFGTKVGSF